MLRQDTDADFLEPNDIPGVVILQAEVALPGTFGFALWFVPLFARRQIRAGGVKGGNAFIVEVHKDFGSIESDDHGLPLAGFRHGG